MIIDRPASPYAYACTAEALYLQNELKTDDIAEQLGISKTTLYKYQNLNY